MRLTLVPLVAAGALALSACASNYAGEGALAGGAAGAAIGAVTGGDIATGAAIGAAAGAAGGALVEKDGRCNGYDNRGRLDPDCYGTRGYPDYPPRR